VQQPQSLHCCVVVPPRCVVEDEVELVHTAAAAPVDDIDHDILDGKVGYHCFEFDVLVSSGWYRGGGMEEL
jgi:hypothetical protein